MNEIKLLAYEAKDSKPRASLWLSEILTTVTAVHLGKQGEGWGQFQNYIILHF